MRTLEPGGEQDFVIVTQHHKGPVVDAVFAETLGVRVTELHADTDQLGTFDGEIPRRDSPLATAVAKAQLGRNLGAARVLASEGTFSPHPGMPWITVNSEIIVALTDDLPSPVVGSAVSFDTVVVSRDVGVLDNVDEMASQAQFPDHSVLVKSMGVEPAQVIKGINDADSLRRALTEICRWSPSGRARVESDLRAHHSRSRRLVIADAARDLARRLATPCPTCRLVGWGVSDSVRGAPCVDCGSATTAIRGERWQCPHCHSTSTHVDAARTGDPSTCLRCNP